MLVQHTEIKFPTNLGTLQTEERNILFEKSMVKIFTSLSSRELSYFVLKFLSSRTDF